MCPITRNNHGSLITIDKQFKSIKKKLKETIHKLKNIEVLIQMVCIFYNMYLCKKVYFRCGRIMLTEKRERVHKNM